MQVEELGVNISSIEKNLEKILIRINRWNSILLFDEIDIFLSHRNDNLEKSAIVGVFLRLLEYFNGIIFFTSNRLGVIDRAVLSRVTVVINFPNLNTEVRKKIWIDNFERANLKINSVNNLAAVEMSGRDVRNYVKLSSYLHDSEVEEENVLKLINEFPKTQKPYVIVN
jgi:SpoVK/Ycf46/Vps4 family AAA+-type ATPase